jgi:hypothetical protein
MRNTTTVSGSDTPNSDGIWPLYLPAGIQPDKTQEAGTQSEGTSEKPLPSLGASQNSEQFCSELSEIVSAWPEFSPEIRNAVLTLLRAAKPGER